MAAVVDATMTVEAALAASEAAAPAAVEPAGTIEGRAM